MIRTIDYKIKEYLKNLYNVNINLTNFLKIHKQWKFIVGSTVSKICSPSYLFKNILTITVKDSSWAYEINMQKDIIIKKTREKTSLNIESIRTVVGELYNSQVEDENMKNEIYLRDEEIEYINNVAKPLESLDDENIKNVFKKLVSSSIKQERINSNMDNNND